MARELSGKELKILQRFDKFGPKQIIPDQISLSSDSNMMFTIQDPVMYQIPNSKYTLIFGDIRKSMSLEDMKRFIEQQAMRKDKESDEAEAEMEVAGEALPAMTDEPEQDIDEDDVSLIMERARVTREEAIAELKKANMDAVAALVELNKREDKKE